MNGVREFMGEDVFSHKGTPKHTCWASLNNGGNDMRKRDVYPFDNDDPKFSIISTASEDLCPKEVSAWGHRDVHVL